MSKEKKTLNVELYDLPITDRKDDRYAKVVSSAALSEDDLINIAVSRRTDLNPATLKAVQEILREVALEELLSGNSVSLGLSHYGLDVRGIFVGDQAKWDPKQHSLALHGSPISAVQNALKSVSVNVRGMASTGIVINTVTDISTGAVNSVITAGGGVTLSGNRLKIAGNHPNIGIQLVSMDNPETVLIPTSAILINEPSKISFIVPANLKSGDYKLVITTQYTRSAELKEPRSYVFEFILTCN